jgi:O-antigen ligase
MRTIAFWLSLILIFMLPWEETISFPGLGTVGRVTGLFVAAFWLLTVVITGRFRKPRPFHVIILLFFLWNIASTLWSVDPKTTSEAVDTHLQMVGFILIIWDLYTTSEAVSAGLQAYVLGAYVVIASTVSNYLTGTETTWLRYSAKGYQADTTGLFLAIGLPVAWHLAASGGNSKKSQVLKLVNYAYIPAAIFAISLTATRFALLATLPAFLFGTGTFVRLKPLSRVLIFVILAGALFALPSLIPQSSLQRLATTADEISSGDLSGRTAIWREGLAVFAAHPLIGIGSGAYPSAIESGRSAHNSFLQVSTELGMIGFLLFGIVLAMTVYHAIHQPKWDSRFWLAVILVWALGNLAMSWAYKKPTWLFLNLVVVAANVSVHPVESRRRSQFPVKSPALLKGEIDETSEIAPSARATGFGNVDSGSRLPFRSGTGQSSQHFPYG